MAVLLKSTSRLIKNSCISKCFKSSAAKYKLKPKTTNTDRALKYFDDFYKPEYGKQWPSIRLALLCPHRYCAVLNNFSNLTQNCDEMKQIGAQDLGELYQQNITRIEDRLRIPDDENPQYETESELDKRSRDIEYVKNVTDVNEYVPATKLKGIEEIADETSYVKHYDPNVDNPFPKKIAPLLTYPPELRVFILDKHDLRNFPTPKRDPFGLFGYYLMDAASLLPALLLEATPTDEVLDLCSAPGGKALALIQTMTFKNVICNDFYRQARLAHVLNSYLPNYKNLGISVTKLNAAHWEEKDHYDKILVDVPCTNDRLSVLENDDNMFSHNRLKERLNLPAAQINMLVSALNAVKIGGVVVYSTCSLSPIQNDGVVHMALHQIYKDTGLEFVVSDLKLAMKPWQFLFKFYRDSKYGSLVLPYLPLNCGPLYFSKLIRTK